MGDRGREAQCRVLHAGEWNMGTGVEKVSEEEIKTILI